MEHHEKVSAIEKCIFILQKTNDGNDLAGWQLYLTQCVCNCPNDINDKGWEELEKIYKQCENGTFKKPYHYGVLNVTKDHECYVYYNGKRIEHFTFRDKHEEEKEETKKLGEICGFLETVGLEVRFRNYSYILDNHNLLNSNVCC